MVTTVVSAGGKYRRVNLALLTLYVVFGDSAPPVDALTCYSGSTVCLKCVCIPSLDFLPSVRRYVGTAVSRLRRPCLNLRLLLYKAISSRAEVAGSAVETSASGVAAGPKPPKDRQHTLSHSKASIDLQQVGF